MDNISGLYYFLIILIFSFSLIIASLSVVINSLTLDELNGIKEQSQKIYDSISKINSNLENVSLSLLFGEIFSFSLSFLILILTLHDNNVKDIYLIYSLIIFFIIYLIFRALFTAAAKQFREILAPISLFPIRVFEIIFSPFLKISNFSFEKIKNENDDDTSLEELNAMLESAHDEGSLEAGEYRILKNIMKFSDVQVSDVMTPRIVLFSCEADKTVDETLNLPELQMYSRFPIWEGQSLDDGIVGYVMSKDVLLSAIRDRKKVKLRSIAREIHFVPENAALDSVLDLFLQKKQQLFLVVDEYGGIEGLLTMEDVIETILGVEIVDEADKFIDLRQIAKQRRDKRIATLLKQNEEKIGE